MAKIVFSMVAKKKISGQLKASKEQILDDINSVMSPLQRQMMRVLLSPIDELDDQIDDHMKPDEKQAADMVRSVMTELSSCGQVILLCDSWYPKNPVTGLVEEFKNLEMICCARSDTVLYDLPGERTGRRRLCLCNSCRPRKA